MIIFCLTVIPLAGCGGGPVPPAAEAGGASIVSRAAGKYFETYRDGNWSRHLVKGFDIGSSIPNYWPGELAISRKTYSEWFEQIEATNANTILVYTQMMPWFYEALDEFNRSHPGKELWLLQQVWPEEFEGRFDLYEKVRIDGYRAEIKNCVDSLAGNADIPRRKGRAWGKYGVNVLPYTLGLLTGREIIYEEARDTNGGHPDKTSHEGDFVTTVGTANAVETWCAEMADLAAGYALEEYGWAVPVGFASWPTLDPLVHPTEFTPGGVKAKEPDDSQVLDPRHIAKGPESIAGIFGTYQIYPYYPEFIYREPDYAAYTDESGVLRYGGYIREFMSIHPDYPALIGEVGLSTSLGIAHAHPEGFTHGGITEQEQGERVSRMIRAIVREGYAGSFIFSWQDEWAKKHWITYPYMVPYDRHVYWHNMMDPEQNFGILAMDPDHVPFDGKKLMWKPEDPAAGGIEAMYMDHDAAFLYLELQFGEGGAKAFGPGGAPGEELLIGIDTVGPDHGTTRLPVEGLAELPEGVEFLFRAGAGSARLQVRPDYNKALSRFGAAPSSDPVFEDVVLLINRAQVSQEDGTYFPEIYADASILNYGVFMTDSSRYDSAAHWYVNGSGSALRIRLPWTLINVSDPSSLQVLLDSRKLDPGPAVLQGIRYGSLRTTTTKGVRIYAVTTEEGGEVDHQPADGRAFSKEMKAYTWKGWDYAPYVGRQKSSYRDIVELFKDLETLVPAP